MQIGGNSTGGTDLEVHVSRENGEAAGRCVHGNTQNRKAAGRGHTGTKVHAYLPGLPPALDFEICQTRVEGQFSVGCRACPAQYLQGQNTVGSDTRHAAVLKLDFGLAIVRSGQLHALKQRRIDHCLIGQHLIALRKLYLAVDVAQAHCTRRLSGTLLRVLRRGRGPKEEQSQDQQCQSRISFTIPHEIHGAPPSRA